MATLTYAQVYGLARNAGLSPAQAVIATAIAKAESGLRTDAVGDTTITTSTWGPSIGLWQIRSVKAESGTGRSRDATRLKDPAFNAKSMVEISGGGKNWKPWSVYLHGTYKKHLPEATSAGAATDSDPTWRQKLAEVVGAIPGVGAIADAASGAGNAAADAVGGVTSALNPLEGWSGQAQTLALKAIVTAAAAGLVVAGAVRLVVPAVTSGVTNQLRSAPA